MACKAKGLIFDEFKLRRIHKEHAVATWNLGTISVFSGRQRNNEKTAVEVAYRRTFRIHDAL